MHDQSKAYITTSHTQMEMLDLAFKWHISKYKLSDI